MVITVPNRVVRYLSNRYSGSHRRLLIFACSTGRCGKVYRMDGLGGASESGVLRAVVSVFYDRVLAAEDLAAFFDGVDLTRLRAHQRAFLAAALGGPDLFVGRSLKVAHAGLEIDGRAFDRLTGLLLETLDDFGVDAADVTAISEHLAGLRDDIVQV